MIEPNRPGSESSYGIIYAETFTGAAEDGLPQTSTPNPDAEPRKCGATGLESGWLAVGS